jgi:hypothetical protein
LIDAIILGVTFILYFFICNGKFDEVLLKQEITQRVVIPYIYYRRYTFSLISPLTPFSLVFKPKAYINTGSNYIFSTGLLYSTSSKPKGKSSDFFSNSLL